MAINWGLINPDLPAQAKTIDAFGAIDAGRNQAMAQQEQRQMGGLRALQMKAATQTMQEKEAAAKAERLMSESFDAFNNGDQATAAQRAKEAAQAHLPTAQALATAHTQQQNSATEASNKQTEFDQKQALAAAPLMLEFIPELDAAMAANPNMTEQDVTALASSRLGPFFDPRQVPALLDPQKRQAGLQRFKSLWENSPEKAKRDAEARAEARDARTAAHQDAQLQLDRQREARLANGGGGNGITVSMDENGMPVVQVGGSGKATSAVQTSQGNLKLALDAALPQWQQYGRALFDPTVSPTAAGGTGAVLSAVRGISNQIPFTRAAAEWAQKHAAPSANPDQSRELRQMAATLTLQLGPVFGAAAKGSVSNRDMERINEAIGLLSTTDDLARARFSYTYLNDYINRLRAQAGAVTATGQLPGEPRPVVPPPTAPAAKPSGADWARRLRGG